MKAMQKMFLDNLRAIENKVMTTNISQMPSFDLHGYSVEKARDTIRQSIKEAPVRGWSKIRFITGIGNHENSRGERGTLFLNFEDWVKDLIGTYIEKPKQFTGYYEVDITSKFQVKNPLAAMMNESIKKHWEENIEEIRKNAEKKDMIAMTSLARCYDEGIGIEQDYKKATQLYVEMAEKKAPFAQYEAGCRYFIGKGVRQDAKSDAKAISFLTLAADQDYALAEFLLAEIYYKGFNATTIDYPLANKYYLKAAEHGHPEAARKIGRAYFFGKGIDKKTDQAIYWWEKSCQLGDSVAAFNLAGLYHYGKGVSKDLKKFAEYLKLAAERNDPDGQEQLGGCHYFGLDGFKVDKKEGLKWLTIAAQNGSPRSQYFLFLHHKDLNQPKEAKEYLIIAAENGDIDAQFLIATSSAMRLNRENNSVESSRSQVSEELYNFDESFRKKIEQALLNQPKEALLKIENKLQLKCIIELLLCGDSTKKQIQKGISILAQKVKEKDTYAPGRLSVVFLKGIESPDKRIIIKKDVKKAYQLLLQGKKLGDINSLCTLGYFWHEGLGGEKNDAKALPFFLDAAKLGDANSHCMVGRFCSDGLGGLTKNLKTASEHYERAMQLDDPKLRAAQKDESSFGKPNVFGYAAKNLGQLYLDGGPNFPKNEVKGIELLKQAVDDGMADAALFLSAIFHEKKLVSDSMYYMNRAAQMGSDNAKKAINLMPPDTRAYFQQMTAKFKNSKLEDKKTEAADSKKELTNKPVVDVSKVNPTIEMKADKEELRNKLRDLSTILNESALDWKIPNTQRAWTYISDSLQKKLSIFPKLNPYIKKSKEGRFLLVIENRDQSNFDEIVDLFKKALVEPTKTYKPIDTTEVPVKPTLSHIFHQPDNKTSVPEKKSDSEVSEPTEEESDAFYSIC